MSRRGQKINGTCLLIVHTQPLELSWLPPYPLRMSQSFENPEEDRRKRGSDFLRYLEEEVWPIAPPGRLGRRLSREEEDEILGDGPEENYQENT